MISELNGRELLTSFWIPAWSKSLISPFVVPYRENYK